MSGPDASDLPRNPQPAPILADRFARSVEAFAAVVDHADPIVSWLEETLPDLVLRRFARNPGLVVFVDAPDGRIWTAHADRPCAGAREGYLRRWRFDELAAALAEAARRRLPPRHVRFVVRTWGADGDTTRVGVADVWFRLLEERAGRAPVRKARPSRKEGGAS